MKQFPNSIKYKKNHRFGSKFRYLFEDKFFFLRKGKLGIKLLESCRLTYKQIEACRKSIRRSVRKKGKITINGFTFFSETKRVLGTRMGAGKGGHSRWVCPVRSGYILCEITGVKSYKAFKALKGAATKLPVKACVVGNIY